MFMSSNTRIHHPVSIYTKSFSYIYSLLNLLCKFGTHLSCFAFKGPFEFEFSRSSVAAAEALLSFPRRDSSCREHISHHFCEQPGFQFQTELFKSLTLQQLVTKGDSCSNTRMVPAGTETGARVFGCVMEQGGEKKNNQQLPLRPLHTKRSSFRDLCSAWFTNKEKHTVHIPRPADLPLQTAPLALGLPRSSKHLPHLPPSCQAAAMTSP